MSASSTSPNPLVTPLRHALVFLAAVGVTIGLACLIALSARAVAHARTADEVLLESFELFMGVLTLGSLGLVFLGVLLSVVLPEHFGRASFARLRLHEVYDHAQLSHFSVESDRDHARNPFRELPDLELCDVAEQVDPEAFPEVWSDVAHEVKTRIEREEPIRIG